MFHLERKGGLWFVGCRLWCYFLATVMLLVGSWAVGVGFYSRYLLRRLYRRAEGLVFSVAEGFQSFNPTYARAVISTRATAYCSESRESGRSMPATIELHESNVDSFLCVAA